VNLAAGVLLVGSRLSLPGGNVHVLHQRATCVRPTAQSALVELILKHAGAYKRPARGRRRWAFVTRAAVGRATSAFV